MKNKINEFIQLCISDRDKSVEIKNFQASVDIWTSIIRDYPEYKRAVTLNKYLPPLILKELACDESADVRADIASKNQITEEIMWILARDNDESVRLRLVFNKNLTRSILEYLEQDEWSNIREAVKQKL